MDIQLIEKQLKALADINRLKLVACLKQGEVCVCDFVEVLQISQPAVSQHLRKLKEAGIITERKVGTWKHYRLVDELTSIVQTVVDELEAISVCQCKKEGSSCSS
ncbi:ArsR/SmtB family transcription factor [Pseudobacillus badius]|uniref:ArsR/SmtB family transcription factor n=1 Tax=Bacillus badius TaxID=1455 RepID=UPI0007B03FA5|nr:metalloregulator ArsR/SmtB family transcription factor [Bacillus badius]KZN99531.1 transcriptional regulator [Bacillus badius]MED0667528.1 metalloregulator ArsR/SmtB family transcription factor [Bacillus badius]OCS85505.1 transcriptional regulator [Bacillus badius]OVE47363.1 transcriptional regulator [Bacillus badius]TDV99603.1 ArsR family transcriptional regulator [Bacillus badius]